MKLVRCEKGHYYDREKNIQCPFCVNGYKGAPDLIIQYENEGKRKRSPEDIVAKTQAVEAEMYHRGGWIRRQAEVSLPEGESILYLTGISKSASRDSIRLIFDEEGKRESVEVLDTLPECGEKEPEAEQKELLEKYQSEKNELQDKLKAKQLSLECIQNALKGSPGKNLTDGLTGIDAFQQYYLDTVSQIRDLEKQLEEKNKAVRELRCHDPYKDADKESICIMTRVHCDHSGKALLKVEYWENSMGWAPFYEIDASSQDHRVKLITRAKIVQLTKEFWKDIRVKVVSGGVSEYRYRTFPEFYPDRITPVVKPKGSRRQPGIFRDSFERTNGLDELSLDSSFSASDRWENDDIMADSFDASPAADNQRPVFADASVNRPVFDRSENDDMNMFEDIISSGVDLESSEYGRLFDVDCLDISADFQTYVFPEKASRGFLVAGIDGGVSMKFVSSVNEAEVYFDKSFLGVVQMNMNSVKEDGKLYLGKDDRVLCERKLVEKQTKKEVFRGRSRTHYLYEITVKNQKKIPLSVIVSDRIPISDVESITVNPVTLSEGQLEKNTGKIEWNLSLKPEEMISLKLAYDIIQ